VPSIFHDLEIVEEEIDAPANPLDRLPRRVAAGIERGMNLHLVACAEQLLEKFELHERLAAREGRPAPRLLVEGNIARISAITVPADASYPTAWRASAKQTDAHVPQRAHFSLSVAMPSESREIAPRGHASTHAPHSMHLLSRMTISTVGDWLRDYGTTNTRGGSP